MSEAVVTSGAEALPKRRSTSALSRFLRHRLAVAGLVTLALILIASILVPMLSPYGPLTIDLRNRFQAPFAGPHPLGADQMGRDLSVRLAMAGRISLTIGFTAMLISTAIGVTVGLLAGFYRGWIGAALMRMVDAVLCFPSIFLLLTLAALVTPSVAMITLIIALTAWMEVARVVRAEVISLRERDFAVAAEAIGVSDLTIMVRELLPNIMAPITVAATLNVARAILAESYISYLGFGIQAPTASWGNMLNNAQQYLDSAPWLAILPGVVITLAVTSFNFIGDGLRDALDPRMDRSI